VTVILENFQNFKTIYWLEIPAKKFYYACNFSTTNAKLVAFWAEKFTLAAGLSNLF
jgi:hypothetical protein